MMEGMFKTAVGGFKKEEVLAYIDKRESEMHHEMDNLQDQLRRANAGFTGQKAKCQELTSQIDQLNEALEREHQRAENLEKTASESEEAKRSATSKLNSILFENAKLHQENDTLKQQTGGSPDEQEKAKARIAELEQTIEDLRKKATNSAGNADLIQRVLMEAQTTADRLLADSKTKAEQVENDANAKARKLLDEAQEKANEMVGGLRQKAALLISQTEDFRVEIDKLRDGTQRAFSHIDSLFDNMDFSADHAAKSFSEGCGFTADTDTANGSSAEPEKAASFPINEAAAEDQSSDAPAEKGMAAARAGDTSSDDALSPHDPFDFSHE